MKNKEIKNLRRFLNTISPSGFEEESRDFCIQYIKDYCDIVEFDTLGNTIAQINPDKKYKVMICGHYDEIGFQIIGYSNCGKLFFRSNGGLDYGALLGQQVVIKTNNGNYVDGVIGRKTVHLLSHEDEMKVLEPKNLWIDIGVNSSKKAKKIVSIGDFGTFKPNFFQNGNVICSKGLDDKIGTFIAFNVLKKLKEKNFKDINVYAVGSVQEEVGGAGAACACFNVNPDIVFSIDVDFCSEIPSNQDSETGECKFGKGTALQLNTDCNKELFRDVINTAKNNSINYQICPGAWSGGGTDASSIKCVKSGISVLGLGIPNKYMHTSTEMINIKDVDNCIKLLVKHILNLKNNE